MASGRFLSISVAETEAEQDARLLEMGIKRFGLRILCEHVKYQ